MALPSVIDEIDRLFDELVHRPWGSSTALAPFDLKKVDDGWLLEIHTEGMQAKDISVEVQGRQLIIRGQREQRHASRRWQQRTSAAFFRSITLPVAVRPDEIDVHFENSTLKINIRRHQP
ncbi:MAG: Hsp20/alpha crystallin family protein [Deltaproteobacteria bacterium]|nr:Hsp20/alpha crystallin family protein [Deltaproteobacteria bacterium]